MRRLLLGLPMFEMFLFVLLGLGAAIAMVIQAARFWM